MEYKQKETEHNAQAISKDKDIPSELEQGQPQKTEVKFDWIRFVLDAFVLLVPTIWFSWIYPTYKESLHLVNAETQKPTPYCLGLNIIIILVVLGAIFISCRYTLSATNKKLIEQYKNEIAKLCATNSFLIKEISNNQEVCKNKAETLREYVKERKKQSAESIPNIITKPKEQIKCLVNMLQEDISALINLKFNSEDIAVAWRFDTKNDWEWLDGYKPNNSLSLNELYNQHSSTLYKVTLKENGHYICYASKREAYSDQNFYVKNVNDVHSGMIIAKHYYVALDEKNHKNIVAELVIFFTTKDEVKEEVKQNINRFKEYMNEEVFNQHIPRMQIELLLYYISILNSN